MVVRIPALVIVAASLGLSACPATAEELPPVPATLLNRSGIVCVSISKQGSVSGAYLLKSMGDPQADRDMLDWVRQLHWPVSTPAEQLRDTWFPMPVSFGDAKSINTPASCSAPA
ncbi:energy transducer TonB family protein [Sphingomonas sp. PAMC 26621]|uniref:energy transducer TonB family protein n=1 Tax=Sphingomonas sp. PAMC 26621 TaxID=1112213 RepID=UPI00111142E9|nr:energy transducer TonB [Sphingomonas sp. PAMC 26621]